MCMGIAVLESEFSDELATTFDLSARLHDRGGDGREVRFLYQHVPRLLPVWHEGRLILARWGNRRDQSRHLPLTGWTWKQTVESGSWGPFHAEPVKIPANLGLDKGVWYRIREGIRGLLVQDENDEPVVYMICEPATRYYRVMTRSDRMPMLIDEVI